MNKQTYPLEIEIPYREGWKLTGVYGDFDVNIALQKVTANLGLCTYEKSTGFFTVKVELGMKEGQSTQWRLISTETPNGAGPTSCA